MQLSRLVEVSRPQAVCDEVKSIVGRMFPDFDFVIFDRTFRDVVRLFRGEYPGFRKCNTRYHDLRHTMTVLLAMARLMEGASLEDCSFTDKGMNVALTSALMHDTGYIQKSEDVNGTGAKYTLVHIPRSIDFVTHYFAGETLLKDEILLFRDILNCTGLNTKVSEISFTTEEEELLGKMLGTADLLGQMADRLYLEKLLFLFREFSEAGVPGFESELDLLRKTVVFYDATKIRFKKELGSVNRYMISYFRKRHNIDEDLYAQSIENNIAYLKYILDNHERDYARQLKRGNTHQPGTIG